MRQLPEYKYPYWYKYVHIVLAVMISPFFMVYCMIHLPINVWRIWFKHGHYARGIWYAVIEVLESIFVLFDIPYDAYCRCFKNYSPIEEYIKEQKRRKRELEDKNKELEDKKRELEQNAGK